MQSSQIANEAEALIPRGITVGGATGREVESYFTDFFSQFGEIQYFLHELISGTGQKVKSCHVVFQREEAAAALRAQGRVKIGSRTHPVYSLRPENAQKVLRPLQPTAVVSSARHATRAPKQIETLKERYDCVKQFALDFFAAANADRAAGADQARRTRAPLLDYKTYKCENKDVCMIAFSVNEEKAESANYGFKFSEGDQVRFSGEMDDGRPWRSYGRIVRSPGIKSSNYVASLDDERIHQYRISPEKIIVNLQFSLIPFGRQVTALSKFARGATEDSSLLSCIMGKMREQMPLFETATLAVLVYNLLEISDETVLVVSPSNTATDEACLRIAATGLKPVRVYAKTLEDAEDLPCRNMAMHILLQQKAGPAYTQLKEKAEKCKLSPQEVVQLTKLENMALASIVEESRVVVTTCSSAAMEVVQSMRPTTLIHDEASQATVPESMIAIMTGVKRVVLVGDPAQLPPLVLSRRAKQAGLSCSLMERCIVLRFPYTMLQYQHRMHPDIAKFPSDAFYGGKLIDKVDIQSRERIARMAQLPKKTSAAFIHVQGREKKRGHSFLNEEQAEFIVEAAERMIINGVLPSNISIISFYESQTTLIREMVRRRLESGEDTFSNENGEIEIANVDSFQGRENEIIIISTVRSNKDRNVGFLQDVRRFNVAISRPIGLLMVVGNYRTLSADQTMNSLLKHYMKEGIIFEGKPDAYTEVDAALESPLRPSSTTNWESDPTDDFEQFMKLDFNSGEGFLYCELCKTHATSAESALQHLNGNIHEMNVANAEREN